MPANLVELPRATVESASSVLRAIADEIDAGAYGPVAAAIVVLDAASFEVFGSGDAGQYKAVFMLERAKHKLLVGN